MSARGQRAPAEAYRERFLADLLARGSADWWARRAEVFEWCRPRPGDFNGRATAAELAERDERCRQTAQACRNHSALLRRYGPPDFVTAEVATVLEVI